MYKIVGVVSALVVIILAAAWVIKKLKLMKLK